MKMQGFRNYALDMVQQREQQIVVDLMPPQYTKPSPPPTPPTSGKLYVSIQYLLHNGRSQSMFKEQGN